MWTNGSILFISPYQFAGDDNTLDLAGAFVDLKALDVAVVALDGVFVGVAAVAVEKHRLRSRSDRCFRGKELGNRGGLCGGESLVFHPGGSVYQQPGGFEVGCHVGKGSAYLL